MRLLLIEDSGRLCESLRAGLTRLGFTVDVAMDGARGLAYAVERSYDVIVLDLMLPVLDGIAVLEKLRTQDADTRVLVLTAKDAVADRVEGLEAGADDYLVKPFAFDELVARVRALARRRHRGHARVVELGALAVDRTQRVAKMDGRLLALSPREFALLEMLADRSGDVVTRAEIENALYEEAPHGNAVDSAICRLRAKLGAGDGAPRIETARGRGYMLTGPAA